jgi:hypothetical protein
MAVFRRSAVFETWHLGDGNYLPLHKGMFVNLSLFRHLGEANYQFTGSVLREYKDQDDPEWLIVVECSGFRFYITGSSSQRCRAGQVVHGRGTLLLDHYLWVEFLHQYPDPPDLFYKLRVERIWMNQIPDRYISQSPNAKRLRAAYVSWVVPVVQGQSTTTRSKCASEFTRISRPLLVLAEQHVWRENSTQRMQ